MTDLGEVDIVFARLQPEEEFRATVYDDATGLPVKAPVGNATWGYGFNVQAGGSKWLAQGVLKLQIQEVWNEICKESWFVKCNAVRRSVLLDIAFNGGLGVLLGYHRLFAAIMAGDWVTASKNVDTSNPRLKARYLILSTLMLNGEIGS